MKKYNIICTQTSINGQKRVEYIHSTETKKLNHREIPGLNHCHFKDKQTIFTEKEVKAEMVNLLLDNENIMYVGEKYIIEAMFYGCYDISWFDGYGFYSLISYEKLKFKPLTDSITIENKGYHYTYQVKEVG